MKRSPRRCPSCGGTSFVKAVDNTGSVYPGCARCSIQLGAAVKKLRHVYIAHPLMAPTREGIDQNRANAAKWVAWAGRQKGIAPMAMWIILSGQWDETPENRELGLQIDEAQVELCDEIWLCGGRISSGMQREIDKARATGKVVFDLTHLGELPP